jgi:hypothetical protein
MTDTGRSFATSRCRPPPDTDRQSIGNEADSEAVPRNTLLIGIDEVPRVPMQMGDPERNDRALESMDADGTLTRLKRLWFGDEQLVG